MKHYSNYKIFKSFASLYPGQEQIANATLSYITRAFYSQQGELGVFISSTELCGAVSRFTRWLQNIALLAGRKIEIFAETQY
jgi:hypothetical protein